MQLIKNAEVYGGWWCAAIGCSSRKDSNNKVVYMSKKSWEHKECDSCKSYNPECRMGACSIYPYPRKQKQKRKKYMIQAKSQLFFLLYELISSE